MSNLKVTIEIAEDMPEDELEEFLNALNFTIKVLKKTDKEFKIEETNIKKEK